MNIKNWKQTRSFLWMSFFMLTLMVCGSIPGWAADRNTRISTVKITVSDYLKDLSTEDSGDQLPSLSESDFEVPDTDQYTVDGAEWYDTSGSMNVVTQPKVLLYLSAQEKERSNGYSTFYYFNGAYTSANVHISGGTFISAQTVGNYGLRVVLSLKGVKGTYADPLSPVWGSTLGMASWGQPTMSSGYYKVTLYRDGSRVTNITTDQTNLNLYPYMTKAGGYYFEVSTVPYGTNQNTGKASSAVQSGTLTISDSQLSNGSGQYTNGTYILNPQQTNNTGISNVMGSTGTTTVIGTTGTTTSTNTTAGTSSSSTDLGSFNAASAYTVYNASTGQTTTLPGVNLTMGSTSATTNGTNTQYSVYGTSTGSSTQTQSTAAGSWYKADNVWYYRTASGQNAANTWLFWEQHYYRLDASGRMLTGFYTDTNGATYYLSGSGAMKVSWALINGAWYYFNPAEGANYGMMFKNQTATIGSKTYYFDRDGRMRTGWVILKDASNQDQYYYFYPQTSASDNNYGQMAVSTTVLGGYTIASDGHWVH